MTRQHSRGRSAPRSATGEWQTVLAATARLQNPHPLQTGVTGAGELSGSLPWRLQPASSIPIPC